MLYNPQPIPGTRLPSIYSLQDCASCDGTGRAEQGNCLLCLGEGSVLVVECPRCCGSGLERSNAGDESGNCIICSGSGWAMMARKATH